MSGVVKSVKKVFKKVGKFAKKIAVPALALAAVVFTGGAALGVLPAWSSVAGTAVQSLGLTGKLGTVLTSAVTKAGYQAAIGGVVGEATGQGFEKGALVGAATGAAMGAGGEIFKSIQGASTAAGGADTAANSALDLGNGIDATTLQGTNSAFGGGAGEALKTGLGTVFKEGGVLDRHGDLIGPAIGGAFQGVGNYAAQKAEIDAQNKYFDRIAANYSTADRLGLGGEYGTAGSVGLQASRANPTGTEEDLSPARPQARNQRYVYDPATGRHGLMAVG